MENPPDDRMDDGNEDHPMSYEEVTQPKNTRHNTTSQPATSSNYIVTTVNTTMPQRHTTRSTAATSHAQPPISTVPSTSAQYTYPQYISVTQPDTSSNHTVTTVNTTMPQRHTTRSTAATSHAQPPISIPPFTSAQYTYPPYTQPNMPPTTVFMPPPQTQFLSQPYTYQQYQAPPYTNALSLTSGNTNANPISVQIPLISRPSTPLNTTSSHIHTAIPSPLTTRITRHKPSSSSDQALDAYEDELQYLNETLAMAMSLKGNINSASKAKTITALKIAINLYTENQALKEQLSASTKRKLYTGDEEEESVFNDNEYGQNTITEMKTCLLDLKHSVKNLTDIVMNKQSSNNIVNTTTKPISFADILKENKTTATPKHQTVISIRDNTDTTTTRKVLSELIQPAKQGIDVTNAQGLSNGKMILDFRDEDSKNKFNTIAASTANIIAEPPRKLTPTIMLKGVRKDIDKSKIPEMFASFNHQIDIYVLSNDIDIKKAVQIVNERTNFRNRDRLINYGITVDPKIRDIIINDMGGKIILDYSMVHVEDMSPLRQCYRCYGFNHKAEKCQLKPEEQLCFHCGGRHNYNICPNQHLAPRCANCIKTGVRDNINHNSVSKSCPVYTRMLMRIADKIQFN